jgi:Tol biopolymer transport system component
VTALLAVALPGVWFLKPAPQQAPLTLEIAAPPGNTFALADHAFAISPDGRRAVYITRNKDAQLQLGIRMLDSGLITSLAGTEGGRSPFWSPDSRWIGFFAAGKLQKVAADGGRPQVICDAGDGFGTWNQNGVILFSNPLKLLQSVSASGGAPKAFLPLDESRHEIQQTSPYFLPDGNHFLYDIRTSGPERGIGWASLDGKDRRFLIQNRNSPGSYTPNPAGGPGWIIYNSVGRLLSQPFDPDKGEMKGGPMLIADNVVTGPKWSTSNTGIISFPHVPEVQRQLVWIGRSGTRLGAFGDLGTIADAAIAPDQKTVAFSRQEGQGSDIWLFDPARNAPTRLTFDGGTSPVWTADGSRIIYSSLRQGLPYLVERPVSAAGTETILKHFGNTDYRRPTAMTKDGRWLSYREGGGGDAHGQFISRPEGKIIPFSESRVDSAAISPDGQWVAYATSAATGSEVFVQSAPKDVSGIANTVKAQISTTGGRLPKWRADGKEMFYLSVEGMMMSVTVESGSGVFRPGTSIALFDAGDIPSYDVTADGQRFLLAAVAGRALDTPITVILNWPLLLRE